jgi:hypothetical protein
MFNDIYPDCGGDGTRVLCSRDVHYQARERRGVSVGVQYRIESPGSLAGVFIVAVFFVSLIVQLRPELIASPAKALPPPQVRWTWVQHDTAAVLF